MQGRKKLDSKSDKGIFIGYDKNSPAYLVYFPDSRKVIKHRLVKFMSNFEEQKTDFFDDDEVAVQYNATKPDPDKPTAVDIPGTRRQRSSLNHILHIDTRVEREGSQTSMG